MMSDLLKEKYHKKDKESFYIAVDFDGTLVNNDFFDITGPIQNNIDMVLDLKRIMEGKGFRVVMILWTCRAGSVLDNAVSYLKTIDFPVDYVNENPECPEFSVKKIYANVYIDDRAFNPNTLSLIDSFIN